MVTRPPGPRTDIDDLGLFRLNYREILERLVKAPLTILNAGWDYYKNRHETQLTDLIQSLGELLPSGIFTTEGLGKWVENWLAEPGRTNDFRRLPRKLRIVAVDLDTGGTKVFGRPGGDHVPISKAVQASCAVPGLYCPVRIDEIDYVDGGVRKTAHISLALEERCGLVICVNPIVPVHLPPYQKVFHLSYGDHGVIASAGLPAILDQVFRVTLHSRMQYGISRYRRERPDADILLFEPRPEDLPRFMFNIMRTSGRSSIAQFAYRSTTASLDADYARLARLFGSHGLSLKPPVSQPEAKVSIEIPEVRERMPASRRLAASLEILEKRLDASDPSVLQFRRGQQRLVQ
jgi:predicted acylesterase/phospholipase RssA